MANINTSENVHGIPTSINTCDVCGVKYEVTGHDAWESDYTSVCRSDDCESYDPEWDLEVMFKNKKELMSDNKIISIVMLQKRKHFKETGNIP